MAEEERRNMLRRSSHSR